MNRRNFVAGIGGGTVVGSVDPTSASAGDTDRASTDSTELLTTFSADVERFELGCLTWNASPVFTIEGEIYADGTWESSESNIVLPEKSSVCIALVAPPHDGFQIVSSLDGHLDPEERLTASLRFGLVFGPSQTEAEFTLTTGTSGNREGSLEGSETDILQATLVKGGDESAEALRDRPVELDIEMAIADPSSLSSLVDEQIIEPVVGTTPPRDLDGDGLYENVRGDGKFNILDVQALFTNLDNPTVQNNATQFNFTGENTDEVTILDVQALFSKLAGS